MAGLRTFHCKERWQNKLTLRGIIKGERLDYNSRARTTCAFAARSLCMLPPVNIVNRQHAVNPPKIKFSAELRSAPVQAGAGLMHFNGAVMQQYGQHAAEQGADTKEC